MTELELRNKLVSTAVGYLGSKEGTSAHRQIIDLYNSHKPLARGYTVKYTDDWCSTFASAVAVACGFTDIIPTECGCEKHIQLFKKLDSWVEDDAYIPEAGDYIFYDWQDSGIGDNKGFSDHVGIVVSVTDGIIEVIEGNINNSVGYRRLLVNGRHIRGYGVPKYSIRASNDAVSSIKVGDIVNFTGKKHYTSSKALMGKACRPGRAKVTALAKGKHPIHLVALASGSSNVYGWVDTAFVARDSANLAVGARVKVKANAKTYAGGSLASFVYSNTYTVLGIAGDRAVIGVGNQITAAVRTKDLILV